MAKTHFIRIATSPQRDYVTIDFAIVPISRDNPQRWSCGTIIPKTATVEEAIMIYSRGIEKFINKHFDVDIPSMPNPGTIT